MDAEPHLLFLGNCSDFRPQQVSVHRFPERTRFTPALFSHQVRQLVGTLVSHGKGKTFALNQDSCSDFGHALVVVGEGSGVLGEQRDQKVVRVVIQVVDEPRDSLRVDCFQ